MTDHLLQLCGLTATFVIFWRAEHALNVMASSCRLLIRLAIWLLVVGAVAVAAQILYGTVPSVPMILSLVGTALLLVGERRTRAILRTPVTVRNYGRRGAADDDANHA